MNKKHLKTFLVLLLAPTPFWASDISIPPGTFEIPDELKILDRSENRNPTTGTAEGIIVFGPKDGLPHAVFIVTYTQSGASAPQADALRSSAVKIGNPFDKKLTSKDATIVLFGGVQAATYSGILPSGLTARSYVVSNNGYQVTALLKGPNRSPYKELINSFAARIEKFKWLTPATPAAEAIRPLGEDKPSNDPAASSAPERTDESMLLNLLTGDKSIEPNNLREYIRISLSQPAPRAGYFKAGSEPINWVTCLSRLIFPNTKQFKSLSFWSTINGGKKLQETLKKHGVTIDRLGGIYSSGEPKAGDIPSITTEVSSWYSEQRNSKLKE